MVIIMKYGPLIVLAVFALALVAACTNINDVPTEKGSPKPLNSPTSTDKETVNPVAEESNSPSNSDDESDDLKADDDEDSEPSTPVVVVNTTSPVAGTVSMSELSVHNTKADCWVAYKGEVYDVTSYLVKHPGGVNAIARFCGTTDFEAAFTKQHKTSKVSLLKNVAPLKGTLV